MLPLRQFQIQVTNRRSMRSALQVLQLHSRVQVVDLQAEEILYTPREGDTIVRTVTSQTQGAFCVNRHFCLWAAFLRGQPKLGSAPRGQFLKQNDLRALSS